MPATTTAAEPQSAEDAIRNLFRLNSHVKLCVFGKTGTGKSSTGNTLCQVFGLPFKFQEGRGPSSITQDAAATELTVSTAQGSFKLTYVDQPGTFDPEGRERDVQNLRKCAVEASNQGQYHVILLVINICARLSPEEQTTLKLLAEIFPNLMDHLVVVFTNGDGLDTGESEHQIIDDYLKKCSDHLDFRPKHSVLVTNHTRNLTPLGAGRAESGIRLVKAITGAIGANKGKAYTPRKISQEKVEQIVRAHGKAKGLSEEEIAKIFAPIITLVTIFTGGGCAIL